MCLLFNYHEGYKGEQHFEGEGKGGGAIGYNIKKGEKTLCDEICPLHEDNLCVIWTWWGSRKFCTTTSKKPIILWLLGPEISVWYGLFNLNMCSSQIYFADLNINDNELTRLHGEGSKVFKITKKIRLLHEDDKTIILGLNLYLDRKLQKTISFVTCKSNWRPLETMLFGRLILWKRA